jgi:hypothetical protein
VQTFISVELKEKKSKQEEETAAAVRNVSNLKIVGAQGDQMSL